MWFLIGHIDEQSLLLPSISGFRKGQSITTVLLGIRDDLILAMKRGEVTMMVMADYSISCGFLYSKFGMQVMCICQIKHEANRERSERSIRANVP